MSIPSKEYSTSGLIMGVADKNPWLIATRNYAQCVRTYFTLFNTRDELEAELSRGDLNNVCKKELNDLRSVVGDIRYKEVLGFQPHALKNDFFEELLVKNRK